MIASCVGTPIYIDVASYKPIRDRTFGHFVRVFVEIDLTQPLNYNVFVEREGFAFFFRTLNMRTLWFFVFIVRKLGMKCKNASF